jgi:citrate lyase beta subunit
MSDAALALGAPLYLPGTRDDLLAIATARKLPWLRSAIICLEDAVHADAVERAFANVAALLRALDGGDGAGRPALFVRPRDAAMLARIAALPGAGSLEGYVLPKVTVNSLPRYLAVPIAGHQRLMPTIETRDACEPHAMRRLRTQLIAQGPRILALRIGGNDLLQVLGTRRSPVRTIYDGPLGPVIGALVAAFAPWGFALSAPVFESLHDPHLLADEVARDLEYGLLPKAAIHPGQIGTIEAGYAVEAGELDEARAILADSAPGVFTGRSGMCEPATHGRWAARIVARAGAYGVRSGPRIARVG